MMKRSIAAAVTAIVLVVGLAACSGGSSNSAGNFCDLVKSSQAKLDNVDAGDTSSFSQYTAALAALVAAAPSEIKADLQTVADAATAYQKNQTIPDSTKMAAAVQHLDDYAKNTCHVDLESSSSDTSSDSSASDSSSDTSSDSTDAAAGDFCASVDLSKLAAIGANPSGAQSVLDDLHKLTPPDAIKDDWGTFLDALGSLESYAANPGDASFASAEAAYGSAAVKVVTYLETNCSSATN